MVTRPIRVMRIIARMNVGGPAQQIVGLQAGLDPQRVQSRLFTGMVEDGEADYVAVRNVSLEFDRVAGLKRSISATDDVRAYLELRRAIRAYRPAIVHTHTAKAGIVGRLAGMAESVPYLVHTYHGHLLYGYFSGPVSEFVRRTERALARRTARLLTVGCAVRDELLAAGVGTSAQYQVFPPGVTPPAAPSRAEARRSLGLDARAEVVAFVGRLSDVKRPDRVLDVAEILAARGRRVTWLVAGEGPLLPDLRRRASRMAVDFRFLGWCGDVGTVYAASDVLLLTSDNEGMPVSLIEAGLLGLVAVAPDVGSVAEVLLDGESGLVTSTSVQQLSDAVARLLENEPLRRRMGAEARRHTEANFSMARLVADTTALYEKLVRSVPG